MAKAIYDNFLGGLSYYDRNAPANQYYEGRDIDPHRGRGYLQPGWTPKDLTNVSACTMLMTGMGVDPVGTSSSDEKCYAIGSDGTNGQLHEIDISSNTISETSPYPRTIAGAKRTDGIVYYGCNESDGTLVPDIFYIYDTNMGRRKPANTCDDDWLSTVPTNGVVFSDRYSVHPHLIWNNYLFIGDGYKIGKLDGETGNDGTWYPAALTLPENWRVTALFPTQNYIGVCVQIGYSDATVTQGAGFYTESFILFWDGSSSAFNYKVPISDNKIVSAINQDGNIYLITYGRDFAYTLRQLTDTGVKKIRKLKIPLLGVATNFSAYKRNAINVFANRLIFGASYGIDTGNNQIFSYGAEEQDQPLAFTMPWSCPATRETNNYIGAIQPVWINRVYVSYQDDTTYKLARFNAGNSTNAYYKGCYTDMGQKIRINYVKFYFKPLVASDSVTPTLEVDYGTSWTLKDPRGNAVISHTLDGDVTSKRFNVKRDCHAFRPVIDWGAGGVAFSKIVVDYSFIDDI